MSSFRGTRAKTASRTRPSSQGANLTLSSLDKLEEPDSLLALRDAVTARLPRVDLPEVLLEMHVRTGFADEFTHVSESDARVDDLPVSICAALVAESCNIGLEPLIRRDVLALTRSRLAWVQQNYIRADTLTRANARLVETQDRTGSTSERAAASPTTTSSRTSSRDSTASSFRERFATPCSSWRDCSSNKRVFVPPR